MNLQTSVNILQSRDWKLVHQSSICCIYNSAAQYLVTPLRSIGSIPPGTLDTLFRTTYAPQTASFKGHHAKKLSIPVVPVVLEKKGSQLWARVELQRLLILTCGISREMITEKLDAQLAELTTYLQTQHVDSQILPNNFVFNFHHDLTAVRELFQQFRINHLADQADIPQDLLSQFMTNKQHPSTQEARKIEMLIQQFGREMLNFSLL